VYSVSTYSLIQAVLEILPTFLYFVNNGRAFD
jgi:hypothetical protein